MNVAEIKGAIRLKARLGSAFICTLLRCPEILETRSRGVRLAGEARNRDRLGAEDRGWSMVIAEMRQRYLSTSGV